MKTTKSCHCSAFTLVLTLMLVMLAGVSFAATASESLDQMLLSVREEQSLQRRWANRSLADAIIPQVENVLATTESQHTEHVVSCRYQLELACGPITLDLADEQAKVNVNALLQRRGSQQAAKALTELSCGIFCVTFRPKIGQDTESQTRNPQCLGFYEQIADLSDLSIDKRLLLSTIRTHLTCWGNGQINLKRSPRESLLAATEPLLTASDVESILQIRQEQPGAGVQQILSQLGLTDQQRQAIEPLLISQSQCHSLVVTIMTQSRLWTTLYVLDTSNKQPLKRVFAW